MPSAELTDREVAVVLDSLLAMHDQLNEDAQQADTRSPNVDSARRKIAGLLGPDTYGLVISTPDTGVRG